MVAGQQSYKLSAASMAADGRHAEWQTRVELAAFYNLVHHFGWTDLIYNHLSARVPGDEGHYLINPFGLRFDEVTASTLITIDWQGNIVYAPEAYRDYNAAGHFLHGCVLEARPDLACLAHVHTPEIMAVSAMRCGLLPITQTAMSFQGRIGFHDYGFEAEGRERLVRDFEGFDLVILRNHAVLVGGRTIPDAFLNLHNFEFACRAQVAAMSAADALSTPPDDVLEAQRKSYEDWRNRPGGPLDPKGCVEWDACLRLLDIKGYRYRD